MPTSINTITNVPEQNLQDLMNSFREIDEADIVTAVNDGKGTFTVESTIFDKAPAAGGSSITIDGKMSTFGGPNDPGVRPDEGLSLFDASDVAPNTDLFLPTQPPGTTGLAKRLNPDAMYLACRWNLGVTPKNFLRLKTTLVTVTNPANTKSEKARPADTGPAMETGRVADLSPGLAETLGLHTGQTCHVEIPTPPPGVQTPPSTGVASGVDFKSIDSTIFPKNMTRALVVMTTSNDTIYWVINLVSENEGGQSLLRHVGNQTDVLLSDTTVFPVKPSNEIPDAVADELNKAAPKLASEGTEPAGPEPPPGADIGALVLASAKACDNKLVTKNVPGTNQGHLACAWAVNEVVNRALGKPIGGGLSTDNMFDVLKAHHNQLPAGQFAAGGIVISPRQGNRLGHVGIVGDIAVSVSNTVIYSNRSSLGIFSDFYKVGTWNQTFSGLQVICFTLNADQF